MKIAPFLMESWLSAHRFRVRFNLAESGMRDVTLKRLLAFCEADFSALEDLLLEDMPTNGSLYLREAIAKTYAPTVADLDPDRILVTTGTGEALFVFFHTLLKPGDRVVTSFPAFQALYEIPRAMGCEIVFHEHRIEEDYRFDAERFRETIIPGTRLVVLNNPHNPTGAECDPEGLRRIVERAREVGAQVLFDEHYRFLPHDGREIIPSGIALGEDLFATGSITKCFGAMGLRMGWLTGDPDRLARCRDMRDYLTHTLSPVSEKLAALALDHRTEILKENRRILQDNKRTLADWMADRPERFRYVPPRGGVVCFPGYRNGPPSRELVSQLIEKTGVFCLPGHSFETENRLRIGLGPEPENFREALERMATIFPPEN